MMTKTSARKCAYCGGTVTGNGSAHKEVSWAAGFRVWTHATRCKGSVIIHPIAPTSVAQWGK